MIYVLKFLRSVIKTIFNWFTSSSAKQSVSGDNNLSVQQRGDNNTANIYLPNSHVDDKINKSELVKQYLKDANSWTQTKNEIHEDVFYYKFFPEFTVTISNESQSFNEPWAMKNFPDTINTCKNPVYIKYGQTILYTTYVISCDGSRYITGLPMQWITSKHINTPLCRSYYFVENSIEHIIHLFVSFHFHSKSLSMYRSEFPYPDRLPIFMSNEDAGKKLTEDLSKNKKYKYFNINQKEDFE